MVNISKTAIMVFNRAGRILKESKTFAFGLTPIDSVREYTYLGMTFTLTGTLKVAQSKLRQKGLRSYFSLKSMINLRHIRKAVIFKLFDALIVPVVSYGCQIWLPQTYFMGAFSSGNYPNLKLIGQDPLERIHLSFLKWTLNVNRTTSNAAIWGDTGRYPLAIELSSQVYNYWERLEKMEEAGSNCFVRHAFKEQRDLGLSWNTNIETARSVLRQLDGHQLEHTPLQIRDAMRSNFRQTWSTERL